MNHWSQGESVPKPQLSGSITNFLIFLYNKQGKKDIFGLAHNFINCPFTKKWSGH